MTIDQRSSQECTSPEQRPDVAEVRFPNVLLICSLMEQQPPPPSERSSPPQQQPPPTPSPSAASTSSLPPLSTPASSTKPTLNPSASTSVTPASQNPQLRPASEPPSSFATSRQQPSPFQHLAHPPSSLTVPPPARGGLAIGVPAHQPGPSPPPASFSSLAPPSFGHQFGGLGRGVPDSLPTSSSAQVLIDFFFIGLISKT